MGFVAAIIGAIMLGLLLAEQGVPMWVSLLILVGVGFGWAALMEVDLLGNAGKTAPLAERPLTYKEYMEYLDLKYYHDIGKATQYQLKRMHAMKAQLDKYGYTVKI